MDIIKAIFEVEKGIPLPQTENSLFFRIIQVKEVPIIYLSSNPNLNEVKKYANINSKLLLDDLDLLVKLFGNDYKIIIGMICSFQFIKSNITFLIDSEYINSKFLNEENELKCYSYLVEPIFITKSLIGCNGNDYKNGIPLDPVSMEPIPEEERFTLGNACYFKNTIKSIVNSSYPLDPLNREPLSQEIIDMFKIPLQDHVILNGIRYNIIDNELDLDNTDVIDISPLSNLTSLKSLHLNNTKVVDLTPLENLISLEYLDLSNTQISDINPLSGLISLESLYLSNTQISDISPISNLTSLDFLDLSDTQIFNISSISRLISLESLNLSNTQVFDFSPLSELTSLEYLYLSYTRIGDVTPLSGLTSLKILYLNYTPVVDLTPLSNLTSLRILFLGNTKLADVTSLSNLTYLRIFR
jgi:Leucine-rich repeat (LRR) protein